MKRKTLLNFVIAASAGVIFMLLLMTSQKGEAHDCGYNGGWQDGYIESETYCYQQAIADAYGNITYVTVCS